MATLKSMKTPALLAMLTYHKANYAQLVKDSEFTWEHYDTCVGLIAVLQGEINSRKAIIAKPKRVI